MCIDVQFLIEGSVHSDSIGSGNQAIADLIH